MLFGKKDKKTITIEGMMCGHCAKRVTDALEAINGVSVKINLDNKTATVTRKNKVDDETLKSTGEAAGYKVIGIE